MITAKEELIQAIERSPDEVVRVLLEMMRLLQPQSTKAINQPEISKNGLDSERLFRENGVLVIKTEPLRRFDMNAFIGDLREERIQQQIQDMGL